MKVHEHQHTASHEPAARPVSSEFSKDLGSQPSAHQADHADMAEEFRKRFWISLILILQFLALSPMLQSLLGLREAIRFPGDIYVLFGLSSAGFGYGGWPLVKGFFEEHKARRPARKTLIPVAVTPAYPNKSKVCRP